MMRKEELLKIAEAKRLPARNAEKDYLLELLLFSIFSESGDSLVLKGGTAMYKFYNLNRFSEDLDFSVDKRRIDMQGIVAKSLRRLSALGVEGKSQLETYKNEINARLLFKGPLYDGSKDSMAYIAINCSTRERPSLPPKKELLIPAYREIPSFDAFVMEPAEIFAEKVRAIFTRNKARDVYDLWFLLKRGTAPDVRLINKKLKIYKLVFSKEGFARKLDEKAAGFAPDLSGLVMGELPEFLKIRNEIMTDAFFV